MPNKYAVLIAAAVVVATGCHHYGCLVKRESELNCPTDIRQTVPWCAGEDAVFHCPCGPSSDYYGLKPPGWRPWPSSGAEWRDAYGAMPTAHCQPATELVMPGGEMFVPIEILPPAESQPVAPADDNNDAPGEPALLPAAPQPDAVLPKTGAPAGQPPAANVPRQGATQQRQTERGPTQQSVVQRSAVHQTAVQQHANQQRSEGQRRHRSFDVAQEAWIVD